MISQNALLATVPKQALDKEGAVYDVVTVPGRWKFHLRSPLLSMPRRRKKPYEGVVTLGCVIRGETGHYDIVAFEPARALMDMSVAMRLADRQWHSDGRNRCAGLGAARPERAKQRRRRRRGRR